MGFPRPVDSPLDALARWRGPNIQSLQPEFGHRSRSAPAHRPG
jgi:hypothetical protein